VETVCDRVGIIVTGVLECVQEVDSILTTGITGYHIRYRTPGVRDQAVREVASKEVAQAVTELTSNGREIILIEPKRMSVENFFLDIVKGKKC
jgi:hypothetical protein